MKRIPENDVDSNILLRASRTLNHDGANDLKKIFLATKKDVQAKLAVLSDEKEFYRNQGIYQFLEDIEELESFK